MSDTLDKMVDLMRSNVQNEKDIESLRRQALVIIDVLEKSERMSERMETVSDGVLQLTNRVIQRLDEQPQIVHLPNDKEGGI